MKARYLTAMLLSVSLGGAAYAVTTPSDTAAGMVTGECKNGVCTATTDATAPLTVKSKSEVIADMDIVFPKGTQPAETSLPNTDSSSDPNSDPNKTNSGVGR